MPSPLAHSLAGYLIAEATNVKPVRQRWASLGIFALIANLADIDYVPGLVTGRTNAYHHYASHSIGVALIVGLLVAWGFGRHQRDYLGLFTAAAVAYFSHLVLDYFTLDTGKPYGLQLFWPLSSKFFVSPWPLFMNITKSGSSGEFARSLFVWHNLQSVIWEGMLFLPLIFIHHLFRRRRRSAVA